IRINDKHPLVIQLAVIRKDSDPHQELPLEGVEISVKNGPVAIATKSDLSGYFTLALPRGSHWIKHLQINFNHSGYEPLALPITSGKKLYIANMAQIPLPQQTSDHAAVVISNIRARYSADTISTINIGSIVKTFQVVNQGNVPCNNHSPCSPDKKWKANTGSLTLEAGPDNHYRHARASCIAGPCPFTKTDLHIGSGDANKITVSALNWSDTTTFLVEAEVFHSMVSQNITKSYPVTYGRTLNFTLPSSAEGITIEADVDGKPVVFPLGPAMLLSWANCMVRTNREQTKVFRCELKPGYQF
ncbi:MAG: hypothetical protein ACYC0Z_11125, partial [Acidobacteriaceae bacterium]